MSSVDALQAALAGEHACVYGYGVLGPHVAAHDQQAVRSTYETHRSRRDLLADQVRTAMRLAGLLEERLAPLYADLVAAAEDRTLRETAARALLETAVLSARWTGRTTALPGIDPPAS